VETSKNSAFHILLLPADNQRNFLPGCSTTIIVPCVAHFIVPFAIQQIHFHAMAQSLEYKDAKTCVAHLRISFCTRMNVRWFRPLQRPDPRRTSVFVFVHPCYCSTSVRRNHSSSVLMSLVT